MSERNYDIFSKGDEVIVRRRHGLWRGTIRNLHIDGSYSYVSLEDGTVLALDPKVPTTIEYAPTDNWAVRR